MMPKMPLRLAKMPPPSTRFATLPPLSRPPPPKSKPDQGAFYSQIFPYPPGKEAEYIVIICNHMHVLLDKDKLNTRPPNRTIINQNYPLNALLQSVFSMERTQAILAEEVLCGVPHMPD